MILPDIFAAAIAKELTTKGRFVWHGFGVFTIRKRKARRIRNPMTGDFMQLPEKKSVLFRVSPCIWRKL